MISSRIVRQESSCTDPNKKITYDASFGNRFKDRMVDKDRVLLISTLTVIGQSICKIGEEHEIRNQLVRTPARFTSRV